MRKIFQLIAMVALCLPGYAQNNIPLSVYASAGNAAGSWNGNNVQWTIGETITGAGLNSNNDIANGFNQAQFTMVGINTVTASQAGIKVFPNPTQQTLFILLSQNSTAKSCGVYNSVGQLVSSILLQTGTNNYNNPALPTGTYILNFLDENNSKVSTATFQVINN